MYIAFSGNLNLRIIIELRLLAKVKLVSVKSSRTSATIEYDWIHVEFVEEEWDTEEKIKRLNELDAEYNNIPLEKLIELTK